MHRYRGLSENIEDHMKTERNDRLQAEERGRRRNQPCQHPDCSPVRPTSGFQNWERVSLGSFTLLSSRLCVSAAVGNQDSGEVEGRTVETSSATY